MIDEYNAEMLLLAAASACWADNDGDIIVEVMTVEMAQEGSDDYLGIQFAYSNVAATKI